MSIAKQVLTRRLLGSALCLTMAHATAHAQSNHPFVAGDFEVPESLETERYRLRMLSIDDVEMDFAAVMSSIEHLQEVWPGSGWPSEEMTLRENLVDLGWHQREFLNRTSFAYTVVALDESRVLGCVYISPTRKRGYDAEVYLWVRASELSNGLDPNLHAAVKQWLDEKWAFSNPGLPGRDIDWASWEALSYEKR